MTALALLAACGRAAPPPPGWPGSPPPLTEPRPGGTATPPRATGSRLIDQPIDNRTRDRARRAGDDLAVCRAELEEARVEMTTVPDRETGDGCSLIQGGTLDIDRGTVARLNPASPQMTCETALAFSIWRRQVVEPAAREIFGQDVVQIDLMGAYSCRTVNNVVGGRVSAHGRGNAIDFGGVRLRDGRRITVLADWSEGSDEERFLKRIRDDACRIFGTVLSPEYNAAHRDHLHLEIQEGTWTMCR